MSQKVLQISAEDAKYIDPNQIASIQMIDGTTIMVNGTAEQAQEEFVEEAQNEEQYKTEETAKGQDGQKLRGRGLVGALAGAAAGAALLGTAAAVGSAMRRPYGYGMRPMMPPPPMMMGPHFGPHYGPHFGPHFGMMRGPGFY